MPEPAIIPGIPRIGCRSSPGARFGVPRSRVRSRDPWAGSHATRMGGASVGPPAARHAGHPARGARGGACRASEPGGFSGADAGGWARVPGRIVPRDGPSPGRDLRSRAGELVETVRSGDAVRIPEPSWTHPIRRDDAAGALRQDAPRRSSPWLMRPRLSGSYRRTLSTAPRLLANPSQAIASGDGLRAGAERMRCTIRDPAADHRPVGS